jgi:hypothetical protein
MTDDDIQKTAALLKQFEPGFLPYPVFEQIARLIALPIIEFVPLRKNKDKIEVLLIAREADDPYWPSLLHTPGTVIRATDLTRDQSSNWPAFERIIKGELMDTKVGVLHYVGSIFHESKRGAEQAQLYWIEVQGDPKIGEFYAVDDLPSHLMESQYAFITEAARHFKNH